jgi:sec-independent protein translocase protein TatA
MNVTLAVLGLSGGELILIMAAVLILFGARKIPEFAKGLGQGIKEFKKASREVSDEIQRVTEDNSYSPPPQPRLPATPPNSEPASVSTGTPSASSSAPKAD